MALLTTLVAVPASAATGAAAFSPAEPEPGQTVTFTGSCPDPQPDTRYRWNFDTSRGGVIDAEGQRVTHTYGGPGNYRVGLVIDNCGDTPQQYVFRQVVVSRHPTAAFSFSPANPVPGQEITFDGGASRDPEDGTALEYAWDFDGDGRTDATGRTARHTFPTRGTYPVRLTVTDRAGFSGTVVHDVPVNRPPVAALAPPPTGKVSGQPVTFDATGSSDPDSSAPLTYAWDFDSDGTVDLSDGGPRPTRTYRRPGTYRVTVTVTDGDGGRASASRTIEIGNAPPVARLSASTTRPETLDRVTFDASGSSDIDSPNLTYRWDFGDGEQATGAKVEHAFQAMGSYTVTLTVTDQAGKSDQAVVRVEVINAAPRVSLDRIQMARPGDPIEMDASRTFDPEGGAVTFRWQTPGADTTSGTGSTHAVSYAGAGTYEAVLEATDDRGKTTRVTVDVRIDDDVVYRVYGSSRIATAAALAGTAWEEADQAILARADQFPDALAASTLARQIDGPILLTANDRLSPETAAELDRMGVRHVYLAGGTAALSEQVARDLSARGMRTTRLAGSGRFDTAARIADEVVRLGGKVDQVVVALGSHPQADRAWPDALVAGNLATTARAQIVLVEPDRVPAASLATIRRVLAGRRVWITGGDAAVSRRVEDQLRGEGYDVRRLAGPSRYATAITVVEEARRQGADVEPTVLASGLNFPDALVAVPVAWKLGGVLLLVDKTQIRSSDTTGAWLTVNRDALDSVYLSGGIGAVSDQVRLEVFGNIQDRER